jgi:hypothetical protein
MSGWTGRMTVAVLVTGALALAGCGGSSSSGSENSGNSGKGADLNQDVQAVNKAVQSYKAGTGPVATNSTAPASWDQLSQAAKQAAEG